MSNEANETTLPAQLMAKPALAWEELYGAILGIPPSTAELVAKQDPTPRFFLIGRRRYIRMQDALDWIDQLAEAKPYHPRRNNRTEGGIQ